jgi:hypothetical protein
MVCFATGRNFTESAAILESVAHYGAAVFVGGAMVVDTRTGETIHRTLMHADLSCELCSFFESHGQAALALQDTGRAGVDYLISSHIEPSFSTRKWLATERATAHFVDDLPKHSHEHTVRVSIVANDAIARPIHREMDRIFGSRIVTHSLHIAVHDVQVLEAFDPTVNKWSGIMQIANRHGVMPSEIVAVGDDINDLHMVQNAGLGVAMGNANPALKSVADRVIKSNHDDGLAEFLEELAQTDYKMVRTE